MALSRMDDGPVQRRNDRVRNKGGKAVKKEYRWRKVWSKFAPRVFNIKLDP